MGRELVAQRLTINKSYNDITLNILSVISHLEKYKQLAVHRRTCDQNVLMILQQLHVHPCLYWGKEGLNLTGQNLSS